MYCFYSYFKSLNWISTEGYLDLMEDILAFYLDCEGKIFVRETGRQKRNKKQMRKKLLPLLRIYLLGQEERIHHVLMKMRLNVCTEEAKSFLDNIFRYKSFIFQSFRMSMWLMRPIDLFTFYYYSMRKRSEC